MAPPTATPTGESHENWYGYNVHVLKLCYIPTRWHFDRRLLGPSEVEWTGTAQRSHFPLQTGLQEAPTGPNAQLICCYCSHCGGKCTHIEAHTHTQGVNAGGCEDSFMLLIVSDINRVELHTAVNCFMCLWDHSYKHMWAQTENCSNKPVN